MADFVSGVGPLFGPDFVIVTVNDTTGTQYDVQVYPDAHNPELRAAGLPTQYYFQPAQVYPARKQTSPQDFDFEMTLFKGLGSEEANITPAELQGSSTEIGGGFCTFSTTFAIPPSVIDGVIGKLKAREHDSPVPRLAPYFNQQPGDPAPGLGIVPITNSSVICAVQDPNVTGGKILMTAQCAPVLADSVGPDGNNDSQDVRYVQAMLNDWLGGTGNTPIAIGDTVTDEMTTALSSFQQSSGLDDTAGAVAPGDATITALQQAHLASLVEAADISDLGLDDTGSFIAQESPELVDTEAGDEPVTQTAFDDVAAQYLQLVHDNA